MELKTYTEIHAYTFNSSLNKCKSCGDLVHDSKLEEDNDGDMVCPECVE